MKAVPPSFLSRQYYLAYRAWVSAENSAVSAPIAPSPLRQDRHHCQNVFFARCQECIPFANGIKTFRIRFLRGKSQRDAMSVDFCLKKARVTDERSSP